MSWIRVIDTVSVWSIPLTRYEMELEWRYSQLENGLFRGNIIPSV